MRYRVRLNTGSRSSWGWREAKDERAAVLAVSKAWYTDGVTVKGSEDHKAIAFNPDGPGTAELEYRTYQLSAYGHVASVDVLVRSTPR